MRCKKCGKLIKENTEGDKRYCQGHSPLFELQVIPVQVCKGCGTKYFDEPELAECPECHDKRIEWEG